MSETDPKTPAPGAPGSVDFGYRQVPAAEKARRVREVFDSVADKYDLMNDLMSAGMHRLWKRFALSQTGLRPGQRALDVAGGTGDSRPGMAAAGRRGRPRRAHRHQRRDAASAAATGCSTRA